MHKEDPAGKRLCGRRFSAESLRIQRGINGDGSDPHEFCCILADSGGFCIEQFNGFLLFAVPQKDPGIFHALFVFGKRFFLKGKPRFRNGRICAEFVKTFPDSRTPGKIVKFIIKLFDADGDRYADGVPRVSNRMVSG